jgi:hypothetical protein
MIKGVMAKELARYEIGWWKSHHRKNIANLKENMARLYGLQFNISYDKALKAVGFRVKATQEHDLAEKFEDKGNQKEANIHWEKAEKLLEKHFEILIKIRE